MHSCTQIGAQVRLAADERPLEGFLLVHLEEGEAPNADGVPDSSLLNSAVIFARIAPSFSPTMNGMVDLPLSLRLTSVGTYRHVPPQTHKHTPTRTRARARARTRTRTRTRTHVNARSQAHARAHAQTRTSARAHVLAYTARFSLPATAG